MRVDNGTASVGLYILDDEILQELALSPSCKTDYVCVELSHVMVNTEGGKEAVFSGPPQYQLLLSGWLKYADRLHASSW